MQTELNLIGCINSQPVDLPASLVANCSNEQECYRLVIRHHPASLKNFEIAELMGFDNPATFSKIINTDHRLREGNDRAARYRGAIFGQDLEEICQNNGFTQWLEMRKKGLLTCQRPSDSREQELLKELQQIQLAKQARG